MRAKEFIKEDGAQSRAKIMKRHQQATTGLNLFATTNFDRTYDLNRVMMAVAATDGDIVPDIDQTSWAGKNNTAHPYTEAEQNMLEIAYAAVGIPYKDLNKGDLKSQELKSTNTQSPIKPFKGYK